MELIKTLYITGYRSFEIAVFQENDPKITVIKNVLKNELISYLENGLEWILVSGNLGVEMWAAEVAGELKNDYPELKLELIYPFQDFGENWNEKNQLLLKKIESLCDYINAVSHRSYQSPSQLKSHTDFLLNHTGASLLVYDPEYPGKTAYFLKNCEEFTKKNPYEIRLITMFDLQNRTDE